MADSHVSLEDSAMQTLRGDAGEGIGLSIVKRLCDMLDASIEMQSVKDQCAAFRILFPRHYASYLAVSVLSFGTTINRITDGDDGSSRGRYACRIGSVIHVIERQRGGEFDRLHGKARAHVEQLGVTDQFLIYSIVAGDIGYDHAQ